jgi:AcrR family transcriptional regulator
MSADQDGTRRVRGRIGMPRRLTVAQRECFLDAALEVVVERGYAGLRCRGVSEAAGMPNNMFYEFFSGKEDIFLALFDRELGVLERVVAPAYESERDWVDRIRAGLGALLVFLDERPDAANVVFVQSLAAGPLVLARRQQVLDRLAEIADGGRLDGRGRERAKQPPSLTAQAIVGGACGVIASHIVMGRGLEGEGSVPIVSLLPSLMASIVLPYRGRVVAQRELKGGPVAKRRADVNVRVPRGSARKRLIGQGAHSYAV